MKRIMILGAGVMQLPAFEAARRCGWESIAVDGNPRAPGVELADHFREIDLKDTDGILAAAEREAAGSGLHGVFTVGTDFSYPVAVVAHRLGLTGTSPESAERASDKVLMRRSLARAGVPIPGFLEVVAESAADAGGGGAGLGGAGGGRAGEGAGISPVEAPGAVRDGALLPAVVKPVDNMGARGVRRVDELAELEDALRDALSHSRSGRAIVEELIPGREYSIDALVVGDQVHVTGLAERHVFFPPYFIELGHTLPAVLEDAHRRELEETFRGAVQALGIRNCAAKGDVFLGPSGAVIGEIAARLSGGYMSGWTFPGATGLALVEEGMRLALGEAPRNLEPRRRWTSAERAAVSIPGRARRLHGLSHARSVEGVSELFIRVSPGDEVRMPRNNTEKIANVIATRDRDPDARRAAEKAVSRLLLELEPCQESTARYLLSDTRLFPDFFDIPDLGGERGLPQPPTAPRTRLLELPARQGFVNAAGRDWNYRSLQESLQMLQELRGLQLEAPQDGKLSPWSRLLWQVLRVGGVQGVLFTIDSVEADPDCVAAWLRRGEEGR